MNLGAFYDGKGFGFCSWASFDPFFSLLAPSSARRSFGAFLTFLHSGNAFERLICNNACFIRARPRVPFGVARQCAAKPFSRGGPYDHSSSIDPHRVVETEAEQ
jgi:hypothetical protein